MSKRTNSLIALALLCVALVGVSVIPPASATAISNGSGPSLLGFTRIAPGVPIWYNEQEMTVNSGVQKTTGTSVDNVLFVFNLKTYGVVTTTDFNLTTSDKTYFYKVTLISDPDESLVGMPPKITGDEVKVVTTGLLINGTYTDKYVRTMTWNVKVPAGWQRLNSTGIAELNSSIYGAWSSATDLNVKRNLGWGWNYLMRNESNAQRTSKYAYFTYMVDQDFLPHFAKSATGYDQNLVGLRSRLMGFVAYNDTNDNGFMDVRFGKIGDYRGAVSSEATYVFKAFFVNGVSKTSPTYNSGAGSVDWSMSMSGINGSLASVVPNTPSITTTINNVGFAFHFTRSSTAATVKVDEHVGTFSVAGTAPVNGLSLAIAYYSFYESYSQSKYKANVTTGAGTPVTTDSNSTATDKLGIIANGTKTGEIKFGGDTYIWGKDGSTQSASSNILSWFFFKDQFTLEGPFSVTKVNFNASLYFYESCFPNWSGYSIDHDPYFATFSYGSTPSEGGLPIVLIVAGSGIGVLIAAAVLLMTRRRKSAGTGA